MRSRTPVPNGTDAEAEVPQPPAFVANDPIPIPDLSTAPPSGPLPVPDVFPAPGPQHPFSDAPPTIPPRAKRTRRSKAEIEAERAAASAPPPPPPPPPPASPQDIAALTGAFVVAFDVVFKGIAAKRGPHWRLTKEDLDVLAPAWAEAFAPYMGTAGRYMPFVIAGLATVGVVMPRIEADAIAVRALVPVEIANPAAHPDAGSLLVSLRKAGIEK